MLDLCRLCGGHTQKVMTGVVLRKHQVNYYDCPECGYVQVEKPHWLREAYENPITDSDTGIIDRNYTNSKIVYLLSLFIFGIKKYKNAIILDYAGGYGILVRILRGYGLRAYWSDKYCVNIFAKDACHQLIPSDESGLKEVDMLTAFEVFEHFEKSKEEIKEVLSISDVVLISTRLLSKKPPEINDWWYYGTDHGQHIGFYRLKTLEFIAKKNNYMLISDGVAYHCFSRKRQINKLMFILVVFVSKISVSKLFSLAVFRSKK